MIIPNHIPKNQLKDKQYYKGSCRNSEYAIWLSEIEMFIYMRTKFCDTYAEDIHCPEDDNRYDVFYAEKECDVVPENEIVSEDDINYFIEYRKNLNVDNE